GQQGIYVSQISNQQSQLSKVADTATPIPGGIGNFTAFAPNGTPSDPCIGGDNVVFFGAGSGGQQGIYARVAGTLAKVADPGTAIPGGSGVFATFTNSLSASDPCIGQAPTDPAILLYGTGAAGQQGIYKSIAGALSVVADTNTAI